MTRLSDEAIKQREQQLLAQEATQPLGWWWLSFCDPDKPSGQQFLGCSIVQARGFLGAVFTARQKGCNPGGEVKGSSLPNGLKIDGWTNRLLTREECDEFDRVTNPAS